MLPYVYDAQAAETNIITAIDEMAQGRIDAIALTSLGPGSPPGRGRAGAWMRRRGCAKGWRARRSLRSDRSSPTNSKVHGLRTDIYPANDAFFMKPLISAMAASLGKTAPRNAAKAR